MDKIDKTFHNLIVSTVIIISFFLFSLTINKSDGYINTFKNSITFMGGSYFMSSVTLAPLQYFIKSIQPYLPEFLTNDKKYSTLRKYKKLYCEIKHKLSPHNDKMFKYRLGQLTNCFYDEECFNTVINILDFMLVLESEIILSNETVSDYVFKINKLINTSQENISDKLKDNIFKPYICNQIFKSEYIPLMPIYLVGNKGVGKTRFVKILSEILDVAMFEVSDIKYHINEIWISDKFKVENVNIYTRTVYESKNKGKKCAILYIDELDKKIIKNTELLCSLLEFIQSNKEIYRDEYINYDINIKNILLICCGNKKFEEIKKINGLDALSDRFVSLYYPDINTDLKIKIITEYITTKYPSFDFKKHGEQLNIIITDDKEPGLRKLYVNVNIFLNKCIKYSIFKDTEWEC